MKTILLVGIKSDSNEAVLVQLTSAQQGPTIKRVDGTYLASGIDSNNTDHLLKLGASNALTSA